MSKDFNEMSLSKIAHSSLPTDAERPSLSRNASTDVEWFASPRMGFGLVERTRLMLSVFVLGLAAAMPVCSADEPSRSPVQVIFDTDMAGDCDDAGALAVLHALADLGEAQILAVVTNRKCTAGVSGGACDAINTFYGRPDIPIGTDKDGARFRWNKPSTYTPAVFNDLSSAAASVRRYTSRASGSSVSTGLLCGKSLNTAGV